jgi:ribonuclease VapC
MILDSSALAAILFKEADSQRFADAIGEADEVAIAAPTLVEITMVAEKLDALIAAAGAEVVPFTAQHAAIARDAWRRYGKGRHKAALNLGDCFSYALAKERGQALLFKGEDFAATDIEPAIKPHG